MKYKVIAWAWLSGFDFLSGIFCALKGQWAQAILTGACSVLAMGLSITEYKEGKIMFSNQTLIGLLRARANLLITRDPVVNAKIVAKIERRIRKLEKA